MKNGKYARGRINAKAIAVILVLVLALGGMIGGTVAWLIARSEPVVNTFTYGDINIDLDETDTQLDGDNNPNTNEYEMIPGKKITKDPVITVKAGSEEMWLFVKLEESDNFEDFMTYEIEGLGTNWLALDGVPGVYYRHITAVEVASADKAYGILAGNIVTVKESVTKEMLNALDSGSTANYPKLTVTAYAVQYAGNATAADAWAKVTANP